MSTSERDSVDAGSSPGSSAGAAIADFYGETGLAEIGHFQGERFRAELTEELLLNRVVLADAPPPAGSGLRAPILLLLLSFGLAAGAMAFSLGSYRVQEERLFLEPSELFSTEGLLIDTLKKRADLDITERDKMIAEYRTRNDRREEYAKVLQMAEPLSLPGDLPSPPKAPAPQAAELRNLSRETSIDPYVSDKLNRALDAVATGLRKSEPQAASKALADLQSSLKESAASGSAVARSALGIATALSSSLAQVKTLPRAEASGGDSVIAAMESARKERLSLLERMLALEQENARLKNDADASAKRSAADAMAASPAAGFLGTVSVIAGNRVLIDIAQPALPVIGAYVVLFRPGGEGKGMLIAIAKIQGFRGATAELEIQSVFDRGDPLRIRDTAYIGR
jgi:hypothetical protein